MVPAKFKGAMAFQKIRADYLLLCVLLIRRKASEIYDYCRASKIYLRDKLFFCEGFGKWSIN